MSLDLASLLVIAHDKSIGLLLGTPEVLILTYFVFTLCFWVMIKPNLHLKGSINSLDLAQKLCPVGGSTSILTALDGTITFYS